MKIRIGDVIKVKNDLVVGERYDGILFTEQMKKCKGNIYKVCGTPNSIIDIRLKGVDELQFSEDMLELEDKKYKGDEEIKIILHNLIGRCNDKKVGLIINNIVFNFKNDINWNDAWETMRTIMPEVEELRRN